MPVKTHDIAVVLDADNNMQVFAVGAHSGQVYSCRVTFASEGKTWVGGDWFSLGGDPDPLQLAVAKDTDGHLELFALGANGRVLHNKQTQTPPTAFDVWGGWTDIGAVDWKSIIIGENADGRLEAFSLVDGGQAFHLWQTSPGGPWDGSAFFDQTGWKSLGVAPNADGRLELFGVAPNSWTYHTWQVAPNGGWSAWSTLGHGDWQTAQPIPNADGHLELFILAGGDALHMWQTPPPTDPCQPDVDALKAAQQHLKDVLNDPNHTPAEYNAARELLTNAQAALQACRANPPLAYWAGPASLGAHDLQTMQGARNADGRLELFALGGDSSIYHIWMTAPNNGWESQWANLDVSAVQFVPVNDADGRLVVFYTDDTFGGRVNVIGQAAPNGGWTGPTGLRDPEPPPSVTLTASSTNIVAGQTVTLSWTSDWCTALNINNGVGPVTIPSGQRAVQPSQNTVYTLTGTGAGGTATASVTINVKAAPGIATTRVTLKAQGGVEGEPLPYAGQI